VKEQGPEHSKTFTIEVRLGKDWAAQAEGYSKKNAAQNAARVIFEQLSAAKPGASL
jgi:ribonuclease-3